MGCHYEVRFLKYGIVNSLDGFWKAGYAWCSVKDYRAVLKSEVWFLQSCLWFIIYRIVFFCRWWWGHISYDIENTIVRKMLKFWIIILRVLKWKFFSCVWFKCNVCKITVIGRYIQSLRTKNGWDCYM